MLNSLIKKLASDCMMKNCLDEYVGLAGVLLSVLYYIIQFVYTTESFDVSSFSIYAIVLGVISESLYFVQGYLKNSPTIMVTRGICTIAFGYILFIWLYNKYENHKKKTD